GAPIRVSTTGATPPTARSPMTNPFARSVSATSATSPAPLQGVRPQDLHSPAVQPSSQETSPGMASPAQGMATGMTSVSPQGLATADPNSQGRPRGVF